MSDFPADQDSEILVQERERGSKLENVYKRKKGRVVKRPTMTLQEANKLKKTIFSKREIARAKSVEEPRNELPVHRERRKLHKTSEQTEPKQPTK